MFPGNLKVPKYPDPDNPSKLLCCSEVERHRTYYDQLERTMPERQYPFVQLIKDCLHDQCTIKETHNKAVVSTLKNLTTEGE